MKRNKLFSAAVSVMILNGLTTGIFAADTRKTVEIDLDAQVTGLPENRILKEGESCPLSLTVLVNGENLQVGSARLALPENKVVTLKEGNVLFAMEPGEIELSYEVELSDADNAFLEEKFDASEIRIKPTADVIALRVENECKPVFRVYNPNSGEHFYTVDEKERDHLVRVGWKDEGKAWDLPASSDTPIFRYYNPNAGDHHYTADEKEGKHLVEAGWKAEGIAFYNTAGSRNQVFRLYNPNATTGAHHFTTDAAEANYLAAIGWRKEVNDWMPYSPVFN